MATGYYELNYVKLALLGDDRKVLRLQHGEYFKLDHGVLKIYDSNNKETLILSPAARWEMTWIEELNLDEN